MSANTYEYNGFDNIPEFWITKAKTDFRLTYQHTSHGGQITEGLGIISGDEGSDYNFEPKIGKVNGFWNYTRLNVPLAASDIRKTNWHDSLCNLFCQCYYNFGFTCCLEKQKQSWL